ncbi:MAG: cysteine hydrolase [Desulfocapsaceae bacterium]|nr:cysteine hydrolase [Desulfocapsaceae bacterium]
MRGFNFFSSWPVGLLLAGFCLGIHTDVRAESPKTIVEVWDEVKAPEPVELTAVKLDPATTAFLILDIEQFTCNQERRPRCLASAPLIGAFLAQARSQGVYVAFSTTNKGSLESLLPEVKPLAKEPIVRSGVDKFFGTDLEKILREHGIETVIIAGTTAEGAVLHTATAAAIRGFKVVVPLDGMSAATLYAEQYTAWHLLNAPGTKGKTCLTTFAMIGL